MSLDNIQIEKRVRAIVCAFTQELNPTSQDVVAIEAAVDLVVNLLQNFNDIAYQCSNMNRE